MKNIFNFIIILLLSMTYTILHAQHSTKFVFVETAPEHVKKAMQNNTNVVFEVINNAYYLHKQELNFSTSNINQEAIKRVQALWETSSFYCTETEVITRILRLNKPNNELLGWQVRNINVFFTQGDEDYRSQDIVIEYSSDGKISDMYIAIKWHQPEQMINVMSEVTDLRHRQVILGFVEGFRTAYNRKDIDFLNKVFSNDALIITGKVLKSQKSGDVPQPIGTNIEYIKQTKKEYLSRLSKVFDNNKYINIKFEDIKVKRHDVNPNIYGVTLRQKWHTSNYHDDGWLFLIIDFENEENPLIWVRTWQPQEYIQGGGNVFVLDDYILE